MSRSTGLPQHLLVVDLRHEHAERIIGHARQAGLAVRTSAAESLPAALRHAEQHPPDLVIISHDGPAGWSFEEAMEAFSRQGHHPMVVGDRLDDLVVSRAYALGAQSVLPATSSDALVAAMRLGLSVASDRTALRKAESLQAEVATREESLLDSSRDPVAYIHEGMHIRANQAYLDFFGIPDADEIEGLPFLDLVAPSDAQAVKTCLKAASRGDIPPAGLDLDLVSAAGETRMHAEITKASYEGEPCLQLTLRLHDAPQSKPQAVPLGYAPGQAGSEVWWDRVQATQATSLASALMVIGVRDPSACLAPIPLRHRLELWQSLENALWQVLGEAAGEGVDRGALSGLGNGMFGMVVSAADAERAHEVAVKIYERLSGLSVSSGSHEIRPVFGVSAVAIGTGIGWEGVTEALEALERNLPEALRAGHLRWFDPSSTDRDRLRHRREMVEAVRAATQDHDRVFLRYRPIIPLTAEGFPFYEIEATVAGPDGRPLSREAMEEFSTDTQEISSAMDLAIARATTQAILAKTGRNRLKVILGISPGSARSVQARKELLSSLSQVSIHMVLRVSAASVPVEIIGTFVAEAKKCGLEVCVCDVQDHETITNLPSSVEFIKFSRTWSGDELRNQDRLKEFRQMVSAGHAAGAHAIAGFVSDTHSMSTLFSSGVDYASGDFLSPPIEKMDADVQA